MTEVAVTEAQVVTPKPIEPKRVTVVTAENFDDYVSEQMGLKPPEEKKEEAKAEKIEEKKEEEGEEIDHPDEGKKGRLQERFGELTAKRKAAEEAARKAAEEAAEAKEAARKAREEAEALRNKYEPPKTDELGPKPQLAQFTDASEYEKAMEEWSADKARIEQKQAAEAERARQQAEETTKAWNKRLADTRQTLTDYDEVIGKSTAEVSNNVRDEILASEVGPQLLYHLAQNPDIAENWKKIGDRRALRELGRLEAEIQGKQPKEAKETQKTPVAEISRAPAPVTPIKPGANAPVVRLSGHDEVPREMTYDQWKVLRKQGKIV